MGGEKSYWVWNQWGGGGNPIGFKTNRGKKIILGLKAMGENHIRFEGNGGKNPIGFETNGEKNHIGFESNGGKHLAIALSTKHLVSTE